MDLLKSGTFSTLLVFLFSSVVSVSIFTLTSALSYKAPSKVLGEESVVKCNTIESGKIIGPNGEKITRGFDRWGYDYENMIFDGKYCPAVYNEAFCEPFRNVNITVNWNESFLSAKDCDGDGKLDVHPGHTNYMGSGAWITNFINGVDFVDNEKKPWTYFVRIEAAPVNAELRGGDWFDSAGAKLGKEIWGQFIIVEEVLGGEAPKLIPPVAPGLN